MARTKRRYNSKRRAASKRRAGSKRRRRVGSKRTKQRGGSGIHRQSVLREGRGRKELTLDNILSSAGHPSPTGSSTSSTTSSTTSSPSSSASSSPKPSPLSSPVARKPKNVSVEDASLSPTSSAARVKKMEETDKDRIDDLEIKYREFAKWCEDEIKNNQKEIRENQELNEERISDMFKQMWAVIWDQE